MQRMLTASGSARLTLAHVLLLLMVSVLHAPPRARAESSERLHQARRLLAAGDSRACIGLLESQATEDPATLVLLCQAYRALIKEALRRGEAGTLDHLVQRLRLYEQRLAEVQPRTLSRIEAPDADGKRRSTAAVPQQTGSARHSRSAGGWRPRGAAQHAKQQSVSAIRDQRLLPSRPRRQGEATELLQRAERAFAQKRYQQAGELYAAAYHLAPKRFDRSAIRRWAYCRLRAVVDLVNQGPRDEAQWSAAERELSEVLKLLAQRGSADPANDPLFRYTRFLQGVVKRRQAPQKRSPEMIRAAEPDAVRQEQSGLLNRLRRRYPPEPTVRRGSPQLKGSTREPLQLRTENFVIVGVDESSLRRVAAILEPLRRRVHRVLFGRQTAQSWRPRCVVYVHLATHRVPAVSTVRLEAGQVVERRIDLYQPSSTVLEAVLRHELAHVWLSSVFADGPLPRWLDEGLAVLAEPPERFEAHLRTLWAREQAGVEIGLARLLEGDSVRDPALAYAASASLCRFLLERYGRARLLAFARMCRRRGPQAAVRTVLGLRDLTELEALWRAARRQHYATL